MKKIFSLILFFTMTLFLLVSRLPASSSEWDKDSSTEKGDAPTARAHISLSSSELIQIQILLPLLHAERTPARVYWLYEVLKQCKIKNPTLFVKTWVDNYTSAGANAYNMRKALFNARFIVKPNPENSLRQLFMYYLSMVIQMPQGPLKSAVIIWGFGSSLPSDWKELFFSNVDIQVIQMNVYNNIIRFVYQNNLGYVALHNKIIDLITPIGGISEEGGKAAPNPNSLEKAAMEKKAKKEKKPKATSPTPPVASDYKAQYSDYKEDSDSVRYTQGVRGSDDGAVDDVQQGKVPGSDSDDDDDTSDFSIRGNSNSN